MKYTPITIGGIHQIAPNSFFQKAMDFMGRVGAPLTVVHPSQNSGRAAFTHPALCETNRSHYHSYILTYIRGLTGG